jgi:hypothetical protein
MLELDTDKRITAEQALAHHYLAQYADPTDEPASPPYDQTFEDHDLKVEEWKGTDIWPYQEHHIDDFLPRVPLARDGQLHASPAGRAMMALLRLCRSAITVRKEASVLN